jgi:general secretion pathway protein G
MSRNRRILDFGFWIFEWRCPDSTSNPKSTIKNLKFLSGFTLVELLVVIAILGILISLVTAGAQAARRRGAVTKAKTTIASLETAIAMYQGDMGAYPPSGNAELVAALQEDPKNVDWAGPYAEFKEDELEDGQLMDPWGNPYVYVSVSGGAPQHRSRSFDLYSLGPNGADDAGTGDDIVNW